ncbi:MAG: YqgE/AlgH family protein [Moraxella sp.]|nr:YqgE/AlgH family protein [Moraxella sp.]
MTKHASFRSLSHHLLIASEQMPDERFVGALIYLCRHTPDGAWGLMVNQPLSAVSVGSLLGELELPSSQKAMSTPAMCGGFVKPEAGFVLHTGLPNFSSSQLIGENVCLTTSKDILRRISADELPHFLLCMGFCHWTRGQLEEEIKQQDWLVCPATSHIVFCPDNEQKTALAYQKIGIDRNKFISNGSRLTI